MHSTRFGDYALAPPLRNCLCEIQGVVSPGFFHPPVGPGP